jgi:hypothetical protein
MLIVRVIRRSSRSVLLNILAADAASIQPGSNSKHLGRPSTIGVARILAGSAVG